MNVPGRPPRGFLPVLLATVFSLLVGFAQKGQCLLPVYDERAFGPAYCYTDIVTLYGERELEERRIPYLEARNEYPVGTGLLMWATSLLAQGKRSYFVTNAIVLSGLAVLVAWLLYRLVGLRALYFSLAPSLVFGAFTNWDLLAVVLATAGTAAFLIGRDRRTGALLGFGAAAKLYPALLVLPFGLQRMRDRESRSAARLVGWAALAWGATNLIVALAAPQGWSLFFTYSSERGPSPGTPWYATCRLLKGDGDCLPIPLLNALSLAALCIGLVVMWAVVKRRRPDLPAWTFGLPLLIIWLLSNKVYSPQFSLWLLPWFALVLPAPRLFIFFELTDVTVFLVEFGWIGALASDASLPAWPLELAVLARMTALIALLVGYVRQGEVPPVPELGVSDVAGQRRTATKPSPSS